MVNLQVKLFMIAYALYLLLDFIWLGLIMRSFYVHHFAQYAAVSDGGLAIYWPSALLVWALLVFGLLVLVVPTVHHLALWQQGLYGALYGLVVYGIYQGTNYALLANWAFAMVFVDTAWGMVLNGLITIILCYFY